MQPAQNPPPLPIWARVLLNLGKALAIILAILVVGVGSYESSRAWQRLTGIKNSDILMLLSGLPMIFVGGGTAALVLMTVNRLVFLLLNRFAPGTNWRNHPEYLE